MSFNFEDALALLDARLTKELKPMLDQASFDATLSQEQFALLLTASGLSENDLRVALLPLATTLSISNISNFRVGAIVTGLSGRLYFGANMEFANASLSQSVHAEQSAISHAWMKGEIGVANITVNYSPCGHCRQFMNELTTADSIKIQLPKSIEKNLQYYLPDSFGPSDLATDRRLMDQEVMSFLLSTEDFLVKKALLAMNASYAPYSHHFSGVGLMLENGESFTGRYAENAAFNPSLSPLQVALVQVIMAGKSIESIIRIVLVENKESIISHYSVTKEIVEGMGVQFELEYFEI